MTLCKIDHKQCDCQPDEGVKCTREPREFSRVPTAYLMQIMLTRGDGTKMALHHKLLFNIYETRFVEKQWPEQLKPLWNWPEDKYPGYKVTIETTPLFREL